MWRGVWTEHRAGNGNEQLYGPRDQLLSLPKAVLINDHRSGDTDEVVHLRVTTI